MTLGNVYGIVGAAIALILCCMGSAIGMSRCGQAAAGLLTKNPNKFNEALLLVLVPTTQGLYGLVVSFLAIFGKINIMGEMAALTEFEGLAMLLICMPLGIVGIIAGISQANVCVAGISFIGKQDKQLVKALIMAAMIELFLLFAFTISILGVLSLPVTMPGDIIPEAAALLI